MSLQRTGVEKQRYNRQALKQQITKDKSIYGLQEINKQTNKLILASSHQCTHDHSPQSALEST